MKIRSLHLTNWRSYECADVEFGDGLTAIVGENGQGKTNLLEAIGWLAGLGSFRGAPDDALIRAGTESAVLRAVLESRDEREQLVEAELPRIGRNRIQVNRQRLTRMGDLVGVVPVTVFSPDDLSLVKGGPSSRRAWIDNALVSRQPKLGALRSDVERILKQRNALLRSAGGRLDADAAFTLEVWDSKLVEAGTALREARLSLLADVAPRLSGSYDAVARGSAAVVATYESSWEDDLGQALLDCRSNDVRRGVTSIGPHRDEIALSIGGIAARTHASQGEQRSLALALRLAADAVVRANDVAEPILLLDDVFSELDPKRGAALLDALPGGQRLLTTAAGLPDAARPDQVVYVSNGMARAEK